MTLTLAQMEALCAVIEEGSFTAAAERMFVVQSSLSRTIADIERKLGAEVFVRGPRGVTLTAAGEEFYGIVRDVLSARDAGLRRFETFMAGERGLVTIALLPSLTSQILAPVIRRFRVTHPDVRFLIQDGVSALVVERVSSGHAAFGLTSHPVSLPEKLVSQPLMSDLVHLVVYPDHPLAGRTEIAWRELAPENLISLHRGSSIRPLVDSALREAGHEMEPTYEVTQLVTVAGLISAGLGVCPLPEMTLSALGAVETVAIPLVEPVVRRHIHVLRHAERSLQPAALAFFEGLVEYATEDSSRRR